MRKVFERVRLKSSFSVLSHGFEDEKFPLNKFHFKPLPRRILSDSHLHFCLSS
jgi:hypothetical protein